MEVTLMHNSELKVCSTAIRTCWQSFDNSDDGGDKDKELIDRVGNKFKHASTLEHLVYTFYIKGISRALLQEFARHRMASLSVKSTRYTLKELKEEKPFGEEDKNRASKYLVYTGVELVDKMSIKALESLREVLASGVSNDKAKYCLPESYKSELTWTINARSLQNFISLRSDKSALWEIRELSGKVYDTLPDEHKYLFKECNKLLND
jgi:thymidylate synthase (FAD)